MMKKIFALVLCICILIPLLVSCAPDLPAPPSADLPDTPPEVEQQPEEEPVPSTDIEIATDGTPFYSVIVDDGLDVPTQLNVQNLFRDYTVTSGIEFELKSDAEFHPATHEILVGATDRIETEYGTRELQDGEYMISYHAENNRVLILGVDQQKTLEGVRYFLETYTDTESSSLSLPRDLFYISKGTLNYPLQYCLINGISILRYDIIIPTQCDLSTLYAAQSLADYLMMNMGVTLNIEQDSTEEEPYEILIGKTNRSASALSCEMQEGEYVMLQKDGKIVLQGNGIYVGAGNSDLVTNYLKGNGWNSGVRVNNLPTVATPKKHTFRETHRNAILMIGDGMGFHHIDAALANGLDNFVANELPAYGSAITQSQSVINGAANYTDSAAGGTALSSGYKTINGYIGVDSSGKAHKNIRELAHEDGAKTAVVTTDVITGATPAAFLGHNISRDNSQALQSQIDELTKNNGVTYLAASVGNQLQQKTREGLMAIATRNSNFFMMVEEGHIDKFSHSNDTKGMLNCVNRFNEAIAYVIQFVFCHPDTALIISADHETGGLRPDPNNAYKYRYTTGNHTNADVPVYAFGPGTEVFNDKRSDNTELPIFLAKAFGDGKIGKAA